MAAGDTHHPLNAEVSQALAQGALPDHAAGAERNDIHGLKASGSCRVTVLGGMKGSTSRRHVQHSRQACRQRVDTQRLGEDLVGQPAVLRMQCRIVRVAADEDNWDQRTQLTLRVSSMLSTRFEGRGGWAFHFPAHEHVKFGGVLAGRFHLRLDGSDTAVTLEAGDFYLLTTGAPFCSASDLSRVPLDGPMSYRTVRTADGLVRWEGEPSDWSPVILAGGRFTF
ncbi:MAG TPA: cupin domain-containing protein, partial [Burkholderiaceae bacterium]